ncbi:Fic family protein [Thermodesulfobacteriota bacterium]
MRDRIKNRPGYKQTKLGWIPQEWEIQPFGYLKQVKSDLFRESDKMDFNRLCRQMNIVEGPDESFFPKNIGLMFFNDTPSQFFPQTQIDIVHFPEGPEADSFTEKTFKGPLHVMLQEALSHIQSMIIEEKVIKYPDRPEADRFFNYPFPAIEEALCNAIYHRSYEIREPVEVRILSDAITIGSFPGPDRSISDREMQEFSFLSRRYRNRRVGEILKELEMTEGRGTGIPKMLREIRKNGSPEPIFHTDKDRTFFMTEFLIHPVFAEENRHMEVTMEVTMEVKRLLKVMDGDISRQELQGKLKLKNADYFRKAYLSPAINAGLIEMTLPDKPKSRFQKYRLTQKGIVLKQRNSKS